MMSGEINKDVNKVTVSELVESNFLHCQLCLSVYQTPRLLPCLHSFCERCIDELKMTETQSNQAAQSDSNLEDNQPMKSGESDPKNTSIQSDQSDSNSEDNQPMKSGDAKSTSIHRHVTFLCPICRSSIGLPAGGARKFPVNPFLQNLCEMYDYKHEKERHCEYCYFDGNVRIATSLCLDCQDNMCANCTAAHNRTKVTRGHKVIPFKQVQNGLYDTDIREYQHEKCSIHDDAFTMFCDKCEVLMCNECKVSCHDDHKWSKLETALPKYQGQMKNLLQGIKKQVPSICNYITFLSNYDKSIESSRTKTIQQVEQQTEMLHKLINEQKHALIEQINEKSDKERCEIQVKGKNLQIAAKSLENNAIYLNSLLNHGKSGEVLMLHREITQRLTQLMHMQLDGVTMKLKMSFTPGSSTLRNMQTVFGKLLADHFPISQSDNGLANENALSIRSMMPNVRNFPELMFAFDAEGTLDTNEIWPTGIAITLYGDIVIADRGNRQVKIYDSAGKLKREIRSVGGNQFGCPFDVAVLKSGDIAITDHESEDVKICTMDGDHVMTIADGFKYPRGITVNSKGEIIVVDCQLKHITVHDPRTGKRIQTIEGKDSKGSKLLVDPYYVTVTPQDNIIVTDTAAPNIKVFSSTGKYITSYGDYGTRKDEVLQPYGVCCDGYGHMFIADNNNNRVHLLLPDGKFSRFLLTKNDSIWHPMGMAINQKGHLAITEGLGKVKVYKYI